MSCKPHLYLFLYGSLDSSRALTRTFGIVHALRELVARPLAAAPNTWDASLALLQDATSVLDVQDGVEGALLEIMEGRTGAGRAAAGRRQLGRPRGSPPRHTFF